MREIEMETVRVNSMPGLVSAVPSLRGYVPPDAVVALCLAKGRADVLAGSGGRDTSRDS